MAVTNFRTVSPNTNHLLWQARIQQENTLWPPRCKSLTPVPEVRAIAKQLFTESPLAGYPGYRPNSQVRRCWHRYQGELQTLRDVASPMPSIPRRSEEQPSFIAIVKSELKSELSKLRKKRRDRRMMSSLSPVKLWGKAS